jgi:hypothetical protein
MPTLLGIRWVLIARAASVTRGGLLSQLKQGGQRGLLVQVGDGRGPEESGRSRVQQICFGRYQAPVGGNMWKVHLLRFVGCT